ncbi:hypothetical protein C2S52_021688 [Perilla frutescens var. hirtella]|nr:hypothetical protein C2S52_021688 [Perilla frutescens var. hirtella]KAH6807883.1 hypothetical protein C2S51_028991 [Perilla frutescens var. frutescens]
MCRRWHLTSLVGSSRRITIEVEHSGWEFDCQYEYQNILPTNHPICRISEGWSEVVDFFRIGLNLDAGFN